MRAFAVASLLATAWLIPPALAADQPVTRSHGITILGKPALPADFPHFPYVNPTAPKGGEGTIAGQADGSYRSGR